MPPLPEDGEPGLTVFGEPAEPPRFLSQGEVAAFLGAIRDRRDRALFTVMYQYGLRVSEVVQLRRRDVSVAQRRIWIRRVKRGVWGVRPLFTSARRLLVAYLAVRPATEAEAALFLGRQGSLGKRRLQQLFRRYAAAAGLPLRATCHSLRHAIATHLLDAGASLEFVKDHLGHRKIENTAIYARISDQARERAFRRLDRSAAIIHPAPLRKAGAGKHSSQRRELSWE